MAYVSIPKDLNVVKSKVMFNLTKRQLVCFSMGGAVGLPIFFILKNYADVTVATFAMIAVMSPFFILAMYEKHGRPLEVLLKQMYMVKLGTAKVRPYKTQNFYALLEKQHNLNKEVAQIVKKSKQYKVDTSREKRNHTNTSKA